MCIRKVVVSCDLHIANHSLGAFFDGEDGVDLGIVSDGLRVHLDFFKSPVAIKCFQIGRTLLQQFLADIAVRPDMRFRYHNDSKQIFF